MISLYHHTVGCFLHKFKSISFQDLNGFYIFEIFNWAMKSRFWLKWKIFNDSYLFEKHRFSKQIWIFYYAFRQNNRFLYLIVNDKFFFEKMTDFRLKFRSLQIDLFHFEKRLFYCKTTCSNDENSVFDRKLVFRTSLLN